MIFWIVWKLHNDLWFLKDNLFDVETPEIETAELPALDHVMPSPV